MSVEYTPSSASFAKLLAWLGSNPEESAIRYEEVRRKLIRFFVCRGCAEAEDLADTAIDRVSRALERPSFKYVGDPILFFYGVARKVRLEYVRKRARAYNTPADASVTVSESDHHVYDCLERCLGTLPTNEHKLLLDYYDYTSRGKSLRREVLAEQLRIPLNALRIRLHRLRNRLRECVTTCLHQTS